MTGGAILRQVTTSDHFPTGVTLDLERGLRSWSSAPTKPTPSDAVQRKIAGPKRTKSPAVSPSLRPIISRVARVT